MGCCTSTPSRADEVSHPPADSSRAALTAPASPAIPTPSALRPNLPIRPPSPLPRSPAHLVSKPPPWSRGTLEAERRAFFETRVSGREEVWAAVGLSCEVLRRGELGEAQGILDASGVSCPTGRVAAGRGRDRVKGGVYDERGVLYEVPEWIVVDPGDMVEEREKEDGEKRDEGGSLVGGDGVADDAALLEPEARRDEKGKGRERDVGEVVRLRARLSDRGTDVVVQVGMKETVAVAIRRIVEQIGPKRVRLAYLGHVMQEGKNFEEQGYRAGNVVNAYVFEGDEKLLIKK